MINQSKVMILSLVLFSTSGCIINRPVNKTLSPPSDTKWVFIEIKNPSPYTRPFPLEVRYISYECMKTRISGANGDIITEPSYNVVAIPMQQQSGDIWKEKIAMTGGGPCKWALSAVNLGFEYIDATHLGKDLVPGTAVGATIAFDNKSGGGGQFSAVTGNNITLSPTYFPLIETNKMEHDHDTLNLFGKKDFLQKQVTKTFGSINIIFNPRLIESKVVRMVAPEKYKVGNFFKIIYPDGTVVSDGSIHPDISKMGE